jgi:hypothetical protein
MNSTPRPSAAVSVERRPAESDEQPGAEAENQQPHDRREPEQHRPGRAGEAHVADRVRRERLATKHDEVTNRSRCERDGRHGVEGVLHE